jgi:hypothetical protein
MKHKESGFSIAEAVTVVLILAILAAMLFSGDDISCTKTVEKKYTYPVVVGELHLMQTGVRSECVEWKRTETR